MNNSNKAVIAALVKRWGMPQVVEALAEVSVNNAAELFVSGKQVDGHHWMICHSKLVDLTTDGDILQCK